MDDIQTAAPDHDCNEKKVHVLTVKESWYDVPEQFTADCNGSAILDSYRYKVRRIFRNHIWGKCLFPPINYICLDFFTGIAMSTHSTAVRVSKNFDLTVSFLIRGIQNDGR
jgi:hypothetical protein